MINDPTVLFADEPTGSLNSASGQAVLDLLTAANQAGQSVVMVTHDIKSALRGSRIIYLKDGVVGGECQLGAYQQDSPSRRDQLRSFLAEMGW
jgi:putative ABC transport system ATP-binding protein